MSKKWNYSDAGMQCQNIWKSTGTFFFFFLLCIEKEDEHLEIVQVVTECWCQKVLSAGCGYFQQWPHVAGTPQKMWSVWSGVTHIMSGLKAEVAESQHGDGSRQQLGDTLEVWAASGGSYIGEATRSTSRRWNIGAAGGACCGRKCWGRCCPTPVTAPQTSLFREPLPHGSSCIIVIHVFWFFFHKYFWR